MAKSELITVLSERGFVHQATNLDGLDEVAARGQVTGYIGFDLTANSLHVGSLIQLMALRWMEKLGHRPLVVLGRATTLVGDPSGKSSARPLLSPEQIEENEFGIRSPFHRVLTAPNFIYNTEFYGETTHLDFLREFGKHFSVNRMLTMDSVKSRLEDGSMSFLEFNYMVLQAVDFLELNRRENCVLQLGGSDQWGNIINGVELTRRVRGEEVFGLTTPLMTNSAGEKMGKTAAGPIWLDIEKTTYFDFWQFWRNVEDTKVGEFLRLFTELPLDEIARLEALQGAEINEAKKILANEVTALVQGADAARAASNSAGAMFEARDKQAAAAEHVVDPLDGERRKTLADVLVEVRMVKSKGEADRISAQGGLRINGEAVADARMVLPSETFVVSLGKKNVARIVL